MQYIIATFIVVFALFNQGRFNENRFLFFKYALGEREGENSWVGVAREREQWLSPWSSRLGYRRSSSTQWQSSFW